MPDSLYVRDFYVPLDKYPHICASCSIKEAYSLMHSSLSEKHKYRTILVYDDINQLLGYLSVRDLMYAMGPEYIKKQVPKKSFQPQFLDEIPHDLTALSLIWQDEFTRKIRDAAKKPVSEVMAPLLSPVYLDDQVAKCIHQMLKDDVFMLPVVEEENVIGVIRLFDMFELIADYLETCS